MELNWLSEDGGGGEVVNHIAMRILVLSHLFFMGCLLWLFEHKIWHSILDLATSCFSSVFPIAVL